MTGLAIRAGAGLENALPFFTESGVTGGGWGVQVWCVTDSGTSLRFGGIARLYGDAALRRFLASRVAVVGVGGVGSWAVEALARSGIGHLALIDLDEICITNVNRQLHAMDGQIGRQKTEAMAERVRAIHPDAEVAVVPKFFKESTVDEILGAGYDAVIDAIDTSAHKALLVAECHRRGIFTVTCGAAGGRRDPTRIRTADLAYSGKDPLLHSLRRSLRREHGFPQVPMGSKPEPMGVEAVFSDEPLWHAQCDGTVALERVAGEVVAGQRLGCTTGLGAATHVTASFGLAAVGRVLEAISARA